LPITPKRRDAPGDRMKVEGVAVVVLLRAHLPQRR
jgi:hypothetical protein